jgi:hypothetical protein
MFIIPGVSMAEYSDTLSDVTEYFMCPSAEADETENAKTAISDTINFFIHDIHFILSLN